MTLSEQDKVQARQFLATTAGQNWIKAAEKAYPELILGKVPMDLYNASIVEANGWRKCLAWLEMSVTEVPMPDYGVQPIDQKSPIKRADR